MPLVILNTELPLFTWTVDHPWLSAFLLALGSFTFLRFAVKTAVVFSQTFLLGGTSLKKFGAKQGAWAVVTGASTGIGREFAVQLAKAGFNVLVAARSTSSLNETVSEIASAASGSQTKVVTIDLSKDDEAAYASFADTIAALDIGVLVNNAGKSHEMPTDFVETPKSEMDDILAINTRAVLRITALVVPHMLQRKRGLILNIGSFAGEIPSPMLATYSASKAFLATFSAALGAELKPHGIVVEHVNTYFVVSNMSKIRRASALVPTPRAFVRAVLAKLGLPCGAAFTGRPHTSTPFWSHALVDYAIGVLGWTGGMVSYTHGLHKSIRKRALRKKEREAKRE
ncbi:3-ketoacyl-CoA reductase [Gloeophyllum trabeum ATCC 11539]|uniref:Very-long-chain 3-oxoacyl-CoA reductase n=1 Tax=Gloeophyllum trabeum (strain ATCC 11539 / FP-39264 / Madison 617) TaxID=670483 RepID=S7Q4N1_GLOTA|nr:3-ketoacyl-CoA reductase [Gloeophyllum trabeum ATCC 11539]EPQ54976.1 3-ketoacyl-CoA reductase [Gloeophyllum trabeum ATCC 11539]